MNLEQEQQHPNEKQAQAYFSAEALQKMLDIQNRTVDKVVIHLWQNLMDPNNSVELIDSLQLRFTDGSRITIGCNDTSEGLEIIDLNIEELRKTLNSESNGKIKVHALDASKTKMWQDIPSQTLKAIQLTKENDNYKADSLLLDFGHEKRTVSISPYDGLVIDYYEDI